MSLTRVLALAGLLLAAAPVPAADYTWNAAANGNWDAAGSWSPAGIPGAADNALINQAGTYTVALTGTQAVNNVTLNAAGAGLRVGGTLNLGGALTLSAGVLDLAGTAEAPALLSGGTVTTGAGGTGRLKVTGVGRLADVAVAAGTVRVGGAGASLRVEGSTTFAPGTVLDLTAKGSDATFFQTRTIDHVTVKMATGSFLGVDGGNTLTLGPTATLTVDDADYSSCGIVANRLDPAGTNAFVNRGTIRVGRGELDVYRGQGSGGFAFTNHGLVEANAGGLILFAASDLTNAAGGVMRANGGSIELRGRWANQGTIEVNGGYLHLGGEFTTAGMGTIARTGGEVWLFGGHLDNTGATLALSAATGSYIVDAYITGGSITAADGAKLVVRNVFFRDVAIGPGVLDFSQQREGYTSFGGTTTFAAGETLNLSGRDSYYWFAQTRQHDDLTINLSGTNSILFLEAPNTLTLGQTSSLLKTGSQTATITGNRPIGSSDVGELVNRGLIRVAQGTLIVNQAANFFTVANRGTVQIDAGATWEGPLATDSGTVTGGGTVKGNITFTGTGNALRPGSSPGTLTVAGNVTLSAGTTFHAELNGNTPGTGHDQLAVTGTVTLGGATLDLTLGNGYAPAFTDKLFLITNDGIDVIGGEFAGLENLGLVSFASYTARISYSASTDTGLPTGGNDVMLYDFTPVPEPGLALAAPVVALMALAHRRRRSADSTD